MLENAMEAVKLMGWFVLFALGAWVVVQIAVIIYNVISGAIRDRRRQKAAQALAEMIAKAVLAAADAQETHVEAPNPQDTAEDGETPD